MHYTLGSRDALKHSEHHLLTDFNELRALTKSVEIVRAPTSSILLSKKWILTKLDVSKCVMYLYSTYICNRITYLQFYVIYFIKPPTHIAQNTLTTLYYFNIHREALKIRLSGPFTSSL